MLDKLEAVVAAVPAVAVQHRHPGVTDRQFHAEALALAEVCRRHGAPLFVNRRLDVALAVGAHLHLPAHGLRVEDARPLFAERLISVAVHAPAEAQAGADLALVSPVFSPGSKPGDVRATLGPEGFFQLASTLATPAFALGGVDVLRAASLERAAGLAVISAVLGASDPAEAARGLLTRLAPRRSGSVGL